MSLLATSKFGNCDRCSSQDTACRKRGKEMVCLHCCKVEDNQKATQKANQRNAVRSLGTYQKEHGFVDSQQEIILDLDRVYSRWLRLANMGLDEKCECFTCGRRLPYQKSQCGHFIGRSNLATRFLEKATRVQCPTCNVNLHGNLVEFAKRLDAEEQGLSEYLRELGRTVEKPSLQELKGMLFHYQQKLRAVETKLSVTFKK